MADMAASVLARLKNKAKESGRSYQLCMQLFCQEEFLRRLEKSEYAENLVLKGGLFIYIFTQFFKGLPKELEEAAWIDGAGLFQTYTRIALPSSGVVIMTVTVFSIIWHWNDFFKRL